MTDEKGVLVIGAGIAGLEASQALAESGRKVYLIERESYIGGSLIKYEDVFPTLECSTCAKHIHPGATEVEGDGADNDCDPSTPDRPPWGAATVHGGVVQPGGGSQGGHGPMANTLGAMLLPLFAVVLFRRRFRR